MKQSNFDERQLWLRGEVFKHSLLLMGFLLLLNTFLIDNGIILVEGIWANILIISVTSSFANIEMALNGAINFDDKRMTLFSAMMGIPGFIVLVLHFIEGESIIMNNQLSKNGAFLIMSIFFIAIPIAYFIKRNQYIKNIID